MSNPDSVIARECLSFDDVALIVADVHTVVIGDITHSVPVINRFMSREVSFTPAPQKEQAAE